jgi:hypothetical protein
MNSITPGTPLTDADRERLNIIKRAIAAGTYDISAHDVAVKFILRMLEFCYDPASSETTISSETEVEDLSLDQKRG